MHAIWFSIIVTSLVAAAWIWPHLRRPRFWLGMCIVGFAVTTIWLGMDLNRFVATHGFSESTLRRLLYVLLSETDKPALQLTLGCLLAGLFSWCFPKPTDSKAGSDSDVESTASVTKSNPEEGISP